MIDIKRDPKTLTVTVSCAVLAVGLTVWASRFVAAEHTIYVWDHLNFWQISIVLADIARHNPVRAMWAILMSLHYEYNHLPCVPSAIAMTLFGSSRLTFILTNVVCWVLPFVFCTLFYLLGANSSDWKQVSWSLAGLVCLMLTPMIWTVTLLGLGDVGGLICASVATKLLVQEDVERHSLRTWCLIGACVALSAVFRRWLVFFAVAFFLTAGIETALRAIRALRKDGGLRWPTLRPFVYGPACSVMVFAVCVVLWTFPLSFRRKEANFSFQYSAYQHGDSFATAVLANLHEVVHFYGLGQLVLACACFAGALFVKSTRRQATYVFVPASFALVLFSRIQTMDPHHLLLVYLGLVVTPIFLFKSLLTSNWPLARVCGWLILSVAVLLATLNFQTTFLTNPFPGLAILEPSEREVPEKRTDLPQIEALLEFIEKKAGGAPPHHFVYLIASSWELNSNHLILAPISLNKPIAATKYISETHDVDRRDGFPKELADAQIVLLATPLQTHLFRDQKVLSVPYDLFVSDQGFAQAFRKTEPSFELEKGIHVFVYERVRDSTPEEIADLHDRLGMPETN